MKSWYDVMPGHWRDRVALMGVLSGLLLGELVYWRTGVLVDAVLAALAGAVVVAAIGVIVARNQARMRALEETVAALRARMGEPEAGMGRPEPDSAAAPERIASAPGDARARPALVRAEDAVLARLSAWKRIWVALAGDNAVVRVGVLVLFVGIAFLITFDGGRLSLVARLAGAVLGAGILLFAGWRLRERQPAFAQALQGGGTALLYLTVFRAAYPFGLLKGYAALVLLVPIVALAGFLAVRQNAPWIAILGIAGGFLAPLLVASGGGSGTVLFSYYLVLNLAILAIAFHKRWWPLNVLGLVCTFGIGSVWGARFVYQPGQFLLAEAFLVLFLLLYLAVAVVHALREGPRSSDSMDDAVVFGAPLLAFFVQTQLVQSANGAAWSAIGVCALYLILATWLRRRYGADLRMLAGAFLALGLIFAIVSIPLACGGSWTSLWALEGAALYWVGVRQGKPLARAFGLLLQLGAGVALIAGMHREASAVALCNGIFPGCVVIALAGLFSSRTIERQPTQPPQSGGYGSRAGLGVFLWGLAWWLIGGLHEISVHVARADTLNASLLFLTGTCAVFSFLWGRGCSAARYPALALTPLMAIVLLLQFEERPGGHPLANLGALAWSIAFLFHLRILRRHEDVYPRDLSYFHSLGVWLLAIVATWEVTWWVARLSPGGYLWAWAVVSWALAPAALLALLAATRRSWPGSRYPGAYLWSGAGPLVAFLALWILYANVPNEGAAPLPRYIPMLNPLDVVHVLVLGVAVYWWRAVRASGIDGPGEFPAAWPVTAWCVAVFYWANGVLLRTLHQYADVPYNLQVLLESNLVQMWISIFWASLALGTMLVATRLRIRQMWIVGSVLMGAVVLKLLLVEIPRAGAAESVVSIIAVGVVMLVIGYVAPVPPRQVETA